MTRYGIVGSGAAGIGAAEAIRINDPTGEILLINEEPEGYYSRPGLAYYLSGEVPEPLLFPFTHLDFNQIGLEHLPQSVTRIYPGEHLLELDHGKAISYDRLLIATGSTAVHTNVPGAQAEGVVKLDTLADARQIIKLARKARSAVVIGGGITALEIVEGLRARKVKTHYFLRGDRYWGNVLDEIESRIVEHRLKEEGVQIHYHTELAEVNEKRGKVVGVTTKDGRSIPCEMVAIAIGVQPRKELGVVSGLKVERGILVDEFLQTSEPDIFTAGDAAQVYDPLTGKTSLDTLWNIAREQGTTAGYNMAGKKMVYQKGIPFNVTRLAGLTTTIIGSVGGGRDEDMVGIARGDSETWRQLPDAIAAQEDFDVNRLRVLVGQNTLMGAVVMGDQKLSRPLQHLISLKVNISPIRDQLLEPACPIANLIADFYTQWQEGR